jgi:hypothetical protein
MAEDDGSCLERILESYLKSYLDKFCPKPRVLFNFLGWGFGQDSR